jgi:hypothetical protein
MAEPNTGAFLALGIIAAMLGPVLGPALLITFGAVAGSLLAMSKAETLTRWEAFKFMLVGVLVALAITGSAAWALERWFGIPTNVALMPVAAIIGAARNALLQVMDKLVELAAAGLAALSRTRGGGQ